jgi:hypothetical protein
MAVDPGKSEMLKIRLTQEREALEHFSLAGRCIGFFLISGAFGRSTDTRRASGNSLLIEADTSTVERRRGCGLCGIFFEGNKVAPEIVKNG